MPPKAEKKPATTAGKAPAASKTPAAEKKAAGKKTAAPAGDKKKRSKTRKETYSSYIYKGNLAPPIGLGRGTCYVECFDCFACFPPVNSLPCVGGSGQ